MNASEPEEKSTDVTPSIGLSPEIDGERKSLSRQTNLHWFHWLIVGFSAFLTIAAWQFTSAQLRERTQLQFDGEVERVVELVSERMRIYEDALWSGVAVINSRGGDVGYYEWKTFAQSLHIETKYPGINGIGVIKRVPQNEMDRFIERQRIIRPGFSVHPVVGVEEHFPITFIEPELPNYKAVGLDMAHERNRREAVYKSSDSGKAQITGPIELVQDAEATPGFLLFAPYYADALDSELEGGLHRDLLGMVYAPFTVSKLMAGTLHKGKRRVGIDLFDGDEMIYSENHEHEEDFDPNPLFSQKVGLDFYGRYWSFDIHATLAFRESTHSSQPWLILAGGILLDSLLLTLFILLTRSNRRTLSFADRLTADLQDRTQALARSNSELESFAYIASHDLRTPLRGIGDLVSYLEEDLEAYLSDESANPDVSYNFGRLHQQIERMERLISGILDYSSIGPSREEPEPVDAYEVLGVLRAELKLRDDQLVILGDVPVFMTYRVRFEQVISNIVGNAFKYHNDKSQARVTVECKESGDWFEFVVTDNGPGIDPKYHHRIFEVFQTLQSHDEIQSTGVGLAIVKKTVEAFGGAVKIKSSLGAGACFTFEWPKNLLAQ